MNGRHPRSTPKRAPIAPIHRGPQSAPSASIAAPPFHHAPNAALLIDFDNVTMGIRSDLGKELRSLLSSEIIKGKVAVQRAYADWRRYPQYIVPLSESSIDLIFAPAYGSSKKNATDIRLAIDALELVFTRPEIGTFILLSGDSDFSSLVIKLKEYGKYVIGVGIRESSSDLLVQNCDEYYSYNALAGLVKTNEEEIVKRDPWELVSDAITRMKRNGDVMRSDRLKQVMQEIDSTFDEKNLGISKFSRFCLEAAQRGLIRVNRLENGQLEVDVPDAAAPARALPAAVEPEAEEPVERGRRGRRGRGRGREREERPVEEMPRAAAPALEPEVETRGDRVDGRRPGRREGRRDGARREERRPAAERAEPQPRVEIGLGGERLTREEAFDLVRRAVEAATRSEGDAVLASEIRSRAYTLLGRDSESLSDRNFRRILQDAHDADVIDLRRRGDDFEVSRSASAEPVTEQLRAAEAERPPAATAAPTRPSAPRGIGALGRVRGRRAEGPPPNLLSVGVVDESFIAPSSAEPARPAETPAEATPAKSGAREPKSAAKKSRKRASGVAKKQARKSKTAAAKAAESAEAEALAEASDTSQPAEAEAKGARSRRSRGRKTPAKSREG